MGVMMMREVCYAYHDERGSEELWEHLEGVSNCMRHSYTSTKISKKISWMTRGVVDSREVEELISIAGLLHDIGKSFDEFQKGDKVTVFVGHDLLSASIVIRAIYVMFRNIVGEYTDLFRYIITPPENLKSDNKEKNMWLAMNLVALPILFHHYAQHEYSYWSGRWTEYLSKRYTFGKCSYIIEQIENRANQYSYELVQKMLKEVAVVLSESRSVIFPLNSLFSETIRVIKQSSNVLPTKYLVLAMVGLLNACDGYVASRARRR